ncbi:MAG: DUF1592 domain-containing protein [Luteolibacter sp.]
MKLRVILAFLLGFSSTAHSQGEYQPIVPFLNKYCVECHGPDEMEGDVRLDDVRAIDAALWIDIYDQLEFGDMPPEEELQPEADERAEMLMLVDTISRDDRFTVASGFRRMNRREYRNTVRELLGLSDEFFDPAAFVFKDEIEDGFDTNSENLYISKELLLEYLRSASISLRTALYTDEIEMPELKKTTFKAKELAVEGQLSGNTGQYVVQRQRKGGIYPKQYNTVIPTTGKYRITATAMGVDRNTKMLPKGSPFQMNLMASFAGTTKTFHVIDIKDDEFDSYEKVVWLEKGARPYFQGQTISPKPRNINRRTTEANRLPIPGLAIQDITIEGPIDVEWPPKTYKTTFLSDEMPDFESSNDRETILRNFISRAFRRHVTREEVLRYNAYLEEQHEKRGNWREAYIRTFAAIMASTDFLYIKEDVGELEPFQLANRLSYFLWSSMPDMELFRLASTGELKDSKVFLGQLRRMVSDPKANGFVEGFAKQWLSLDELGTMRPSEDDREYSVYYRNEIESAMMEETLSYFRYVLFENQPITDFLDSDYTFLNKDLAELYDIPFDGGYEMKLVKLPSDSVRGGLLGHGSIHAVTSNGVETLPVTRGHWVLDELMGTPPPPAPSEVPALVPDLTGVNTPRDLLKQHREDPKCFSCHKVMDPAGLALESFDIIGRYRESYGKNSRIDASGDYHGTKFDDVRGLREALMQRKDPFTYNFIVKLSEYAKGRKLNRKDHEIVKGIALKAKDYDYAFMNILGEILTSDLMLQR